MALMKEDKKDFFILVFSNETQVLACESLIRKNNFKTKIISIPRKVSSGCGMALRLLIENKKEILDILEKNNINYLTLLNMEEL